MLLAMALSLEIVSRAWMLTWQKEILTLKKSFAKW